MSFIMWLIARKKNNKKPRLLSELAMVWGLWKLQEPSATAQWDCFTSHWAALDRNFTLPCLLFLSQENLFLFFFYRRKCFFFFVLSCTSGQGNHPSFFLQSNHHSLYKITNYPFSINPSLVQDHMRRGLIEVAPRFRISSISPCLEGSTRPHH